jgi:two-component sensor histidine kinase
VLAREADHRIKNSLQTLLVLLRQQAGRAEADTVHAATGNNGVLPELTLDDYLGSLCAALGKTMGVDGERRALHVEVEPLAVSPATAQHLGLIVAELVTNALRHAFDPDQAGKVMVTGGRRGDGCYQLRVEDDGRGLPEDFDLRLRESGLGLRMVNILVDQARARLSAEGRDGARFTLVLPAH